MVIVPGFLAVSGEGEIVSLGRGGSDLSAVLLAAALGAETCELIKDVPGYFDADPNIDATARHVPSLTFDDAIARAAAGCPLVQAESLAIARAEGLRVVIRAASRDGRRTVVYGRAAGHPATATTEGAESDGVRHEDDSRRAAVGA